MTQAIETSSNISRDGADRSKLDLAGARAAGFSPADTLYERGTRVVQLGVNNARRSRIDHEKKPTVADYCGEFTQLIAGENRADRVVPVRELKMLEDGWLERGGNKLPIAEPAFLGLLSRMGIRGGRYLADLEPVRRAYNFNTDVAEWVKRETEQGGEPGNVTLRLRKKAGNGPEIYAAVGGRYAPFDCDKIAAALALAAPKDARGTVAYDGRQTRFEVMFHSDIQPERYVCGEFFKAGVLVRTDDTGGGSIKLSAVVWQNLCLNLIILDKSTQEIASLRHVGSVDALADKFRAGFDQALRSIDHFRKAWGYALGDDVVADARNEHREAYDLSVDQVMAGVFSGVVDDHRMPLPRSQGKRAEIVGDLMSMWKRDESAAAGPTRAAVVNAVTRYAHEVNQDPWREDALQSAAGSLLFGRGSAKPKALPWSPVGSIVRVAMRDGSTIEVPAYEALELGADKGQVGAAVLADMLGEEN